jgi:hypothetical protein
VTVTGNRKGKLTATVSAAALAGALRKLSLHLTKAHVRGTVTLTVSDGIHTAKVTIKVQG